MLLAELRQQGPHVAGGRHARAEVKTLGGVPIRLIGLKNGLPQLRRSFHQVADFASQRLVVAAPEHIQCPLDCGGV